MVTRRNNTGWLLAARIAAALALVAVGGDHLYEYTVDYYSAIPTIGVLFLLNGIGGCALGAATLVPLELFLARRTAFRLTAVTAAAGISLAAVSLVALFVSEATTLFGFMEAGYRTSIVIAIVAEAAAIIFLVAVVALVGADVNRDRVRPRPTVRPAPPV
jgi:hypothetical protein